MTDRKEIMELKEKIEGLGGTVTITNDAEGWIDSVKIEGIKGVGPCAMNPVYAAERMREVVADASRIKVTVKAKASPRARKIHIWQRFAADMAEAIESAKHAVNEEFSGEGILISVTEGWQ